VGGPRVDHQKHQLRASSTYRTARSLDPGLLSTLLQLVLQIQLLDLSSVHRLEWLFVRNTVNIHVVIMFISDYRWLRFLALSISIYNYFNLYAHALILTVIRGVSMRYQVCNRCLLSSGRFRCSPRRWRFLFFKNLPFCYVFFTSESSYCFERVLAIAILSVRLSVCLSHGWISQKRCKLGSPNFYRWLPERL